jgi:hypothetical protein
MDRDRHTDDVAERGRVAFAALMGDRPLVLPPLYTGHRLPKARGHPSPTRGGPGGPRKAVKAHADHGTLKRGRDPFGPYVDRDAAEADGDSDDAEDEGEAEGFEHTAGKRLRNNDAGRGGEGSGGDGWDWVPPPAAPPMPWMGPALSVAPAGAGYPMLGFFGREVRAVEGHRRAPPRCLHNEGDVFGFVWAGGARVADVR